MASAAAPENLPLFYQRLEPLSTNAHAIWRTRPTDKAPFLARTHAVPLTVDEFVLAQRFYPIVFSVGDNPVPLALMGLNEGMNVFVDAEGKLRDEVYVPAYVRRYPFVFANDDTGDRMIVCIDRAADAVSEQPDAPFFENGEPSEFTRNAIKFCEDFETERRRTDSFLELMRELDLLETKRAVFQPRNPDGSPMGDPQTVAEYYAVSEERLKGLSAEKFAELRDNGALAQIYAHLTSLLGWDRLIARALARGQARANAAANSN